MSHTRRRPRTGFTTRPITSRRRSISDILSGRRRARKARSEITAERFGGPGGLRESAASGGRLFTVGQGRRVARDERDIALGRERTARIERVGELGFGAGVGVGDLTAEQFKTFKRRTTAGGPRRPRVPAVKKEIQTEEQIELGKARSAFEAKEKLRFEERREKDIIRRFGSVEQFEETQQRIGSAVQAEKRVLQDLRESAGPLKAAFREFKGEFGPTRDVMRTFFRIKSGPNAGRVRAPDPLTFSKRILQELKSGSRGNQQLARRFLQTMGDRLIPTKATRGKKGFRAFKELLEKQVALAGKVQSESARFGKKSAGFEQDIALGAGVQFDPGTLTGFEESEEFTEFRTRFPGSSHKLEEGAGAFGTHNGEDHLDIQEGQNLQEGDDGQFTIEEDDLDFELDPAKRAEERFNRSRDQALEDINLKFDDPIRNLEGESLIGGARSTQQNKRIARLKRRRKTSVDRLELRFKEGKEDMALAELERQQEVAEKIAKRNTPQAQSKRRLQQEQLAGTNGVIREFADKGEKISFLKAQNVWLSRQKFNSSVSARFSENAEVLDETVLREGFDRSQALETAVQRFDDDVLQAEKYLKSRGFLDSEIRLQKEDFQRDVLGFTDEQIAENRKDESLNKRLTRAFAGRASEAEMIQLKEELETIEISNPKKAARIRFKIENPDSTLAEMEANIERLFPAKSERKGVDQLSEVGKFVLEEEFDDINIRNLARNSGKVQKFDLTRKDRAILLSKKLQISESEAEAGIDKIDQAVEGGEDERSIFQRIRDFFTGATEEGGEPTDVANKTVDDFTDDELNGLSDEEFDQVMKNSR